MTTETIKPNDGPTSTESVPGGDYVDRPVRSCSFTDTDRLNYLLQFIRIDDVGDEECCKGIVVDSESMEEKVGLGPMGDDWRMPGTIQDWDDDLRDVIDRAMVAHNFANGSDVRRQPLEVKAIIEQKENYENRTPKTNQSGV